MMEPIVLKKYNFGKLPKKDWVLDGAKGREPRFIRSLFLEEGGLEQNNIELKKKYDLIEKQEIDYEEYFTKNCNTLFIGYGIVGRMLKELVQIARKDGKKWGLFRPINLWPFPYERISQLSKKVEKVNIVELSLGQMIDDIKIAVKDKKIDFYGRAGGGVLTIEELWERFK